MSKLKIISREINNLTDARYFAAMGVDFLGFNLSQDQEGSVDPSFVKQIKDWVSGPEILLYFEGFEKKDYIDEVIEVVKPNALSFGAFTDPELLQYYSKHSIFIQSHSDLLESLQINNEQDLILHFQETDQLNSLLKHLEANKLQANSIYLDGPLGPSEMTSELLNRIDGIVIKGGDEEKTGYKSYDDLDQLFDWIEANPL